MELLLAAVFGALATQVIGALMIAFPEIRRHDRQIALWAFSKFTGHAFKPPVSGEEAVHRYTDQPVAGVHRWEYASSGDYSQALDGWVR